MPSRVPHRLFIERLLLQLRNNLLTYLRFLLVCFIWLGLVPFLARWIWRFYFRFGDWSPASPLPVSPNQTVEEGAANATIAGIFDEGFFGWMKGSDLWTAVLRDCFQGQIITICLVAVFVVIFLIREWVMQNAMGVIEEGGAPAVPVVREPRNMEEQPEIINLFGHQFQRFDDIPPMGEDEPIATDGVAVDPDEGHEEEDTDSLAVQPSDHGGHEHMGDNPYLDEPRYPEWARHRTDYLVDTFTG